MTHVARHLVAWVAWWTTCFWLWFLLVGEWNRIEIVAAACAATVAATIGEVARVRGQVRARVPLVWIRRAATVPLAIFTDFGVIVWALVASVARRQVVRGAFRSRSFPAGGDDPASAGTRAWVEVMATYSPNAYVIDIDVERGRVLLHDLVPSRQSESPA